MEIAFASRRLRAVCEDGTVAAMNLDAAVNDVLQDRLADLRAADSILDLPGVEPEMLEVPEATVRIPLVDGYALVAKPNHRQPPRLPDGSTAWNRVRRLQITGISR